MPKEKSVLIGFIVFFLILPAASMAGYNYQGKILQPFAFIDPLVPGQVFKVWAPVGGDHGRWSVGASSDFLRNTDNSDDMDVIVSITGAYGISDRLTVGGVLPYIVRDPEFNESDFLDLKAFARYRLTGNNSGPGVGVELLASLPTAAQGGSYPFTLDTTLLKISVAASGTASDWEYGLNLGYQSYVQSESGDDSDLFYGVYAGKSIASNLTGVLEYSASTHTHTEGSLEQEITDATALLGIKYRFKDNLTLGLAAGTGMSDSFADLRSQVNILWVPAIAEPAEAAAVIQESAPEDSAKTPPPVLGGDLITGIKPGKGDILVQVSNRSGVKGLGERMARYLEKAGYVVPVVDEGPGKKWERSFIYYGGKHLTPATDIKLLLARPDTLKRVSYRLKGVGVLIVLGEDIAGWRR